MKRNPSHTAMGAITGFAVATAAATAAMAYIHGTTAEIEFDLLDTGFNEDCLATELGMPKSFSTAFHC